MPMRFLRPALVAIAGAALISPTVAQAALTVSITQHPAKISNVKSPVFRFSANSVRSARCKIDSRAWVNNCHSPHSFGTLANGHHTVTYAVVSDAGAKAQTSYSWLLDASAPHVPSVTGGMTGIGAPSDWSNAASHGLVTHPTTDVGGAGIDHYEYLVWTWESGYQPIHTGSQLTITAEGHAEVRFRAVDRAGNVSAWAAPSLVQLDRHAPTAPGADGFDQDGTASDDQFGGTVLTSGMNLSLSYQYRYSANDGESWSAPQDGGHADLHGAGDYLLQFRALDPAGNTSDWGVPGTVRVGSNLADFGTPVVWGGSGAAPVGGPPEGYCLGWGFMTDPGFPVDSLDDFQFQYSGDGGQSWTDVSGSGCFHPPGPGMWIAHIRIHNPNTDQWSDWSEITDESTLNCQP